MKRMLSIILCACMLFPALSGCVTISLKDAPEEKIAPSGGQGANSNGNGSNNGGETPNLDTDEPKTNDILAIAKKYYDYHSKALRNDLKNEFSGDVGSASFDGKSKDDEKAEKLCTIAAVIAISEGDGDYAAACAAAAIGWSQGYARGAGTLAAVLEMAGFITDKDRLNDAKKLAEYAISLDKNDIGFYMTLARALYQLGDLEGALAAIEAALAIEPGNNAALMLKIEILSKKGGTFLSAQAPGLAKGLEESDGELSKRLTELENSTKDVEMATDGDSKEEALRKLELIYALDPITPADMIDGVFADAAKRIRNQVNTVTPEDIAKVTNLFPVFPNGLYRTMDQVKRMEKEINYYWEWNDICNEKKYNELFLPAQMAVDAATDERGRQKISPESPEATALDYQWAYNWQMYRAAAASFRRYIGKLWDELHDRQNECHLAWQRRYNEAQRLPAGQSGGYARELAENEAANIYFKEAMPLYAKLFDEVAKAAARHWEKTLPFARATQFPELYVFELYANVYHDASDALYILRPQIIHTRYHEDVAIADIQAIEEAIAEAALLAEEAAKSSVYEDATNGITISVEFGLFEFKVSNTKIELEYVNGLAARVAFDWKSQELEMGVGVGIKMKLSGTKTGVEAKMYNNIVFDLRKNVVTDAYYSAELKGSIQGLEAGAQLKASVMGKGTRFSTAAKTKIVNYLVEHENEIIAQK